MRSETRGSLERRAARSATNDDELYRMRRAAWRSQGIAVLRVAEISDPWVRQAIENEASRLYGQKEDA